MQGDYWFNIFIKVQMQLPSELFQQLFFFWFSSGVKMFSGADQAIANWKFESSHHFIVTLNSLTSIQVTVSSNLAAFYVRTIY